MSLISLIFFFIDTIVSVIIVAINIIIIITILMILFAKKKKPRPTKNRCCSSHIEKNKNEEKVALKRSIKENIPIPTILLSLFTMQAPTCVLGSFDLIADKNATDIK